MTNAELKQLVEDFDLTVEANNPKKPTKAEYVTVLDAYKRHQEIINGIEPEVEDESLEEVVEVAVAYKDLPKAEKAKLQRADLMRKECVIVQDTQTTQTSMSNAYIAWGNDLIGQHTDIVYFGKKWMVRRGAIKNMRDVIITEKNQKNFAAAILPTTRPRYIIVPAEGMNKDEIAAKVVEQALRNATTVS